MVLTTACHLAPPKINLIWCPRLLDYYMVSLVVFESIMLVIKNKAVNALHNPQETAHTEYRYF